MLQVTRRKMLVSTGLAIMSASNEMRGQTAGIFNSNSAGTIRPEDFGAKGDGQFDDNLAFELLFNNLRTKRHQTVQLTSGKVYTYTNPFLFGNVPAGFTIEGNGAKLVNIRGSNGPRAGYNANYLAMQMPTPFLPNGSELLTYGSGQGPALNDFGAKIKSARKGVSEIETSDGSEFLNAGSVFIYGFDRQNSPSFPPCPRYFEYNEVVSLLSRNGYKNNIARLARPLGFDYDARWPDVTNSGANKYGAVRTLLLNRPVGKFRRFAFMEKVVIRNTHFADNPGWTHASAEMNNGKVTVGGAKHIVLDNVRCHHLYVSVCDIVEMRNCQVDDYFEPDKCVNKVTLNNCKLGQCVGGLGVREIYLNDTDILNRNALAPLERLEVKGGRVSGRGEFSSSNAFSGYLYGSDKVVLDRVTYVASIESVNQVIAPALYKLAIQLVNPSTIRMSRADYDASRIEHCIRIGAILYRSDSTAAFKVLRMPYCTGDVETSDVLIEGQVLGAALVAGSLLYLTTTPDIEIKNLLVEGAYAHQLTSFAGTLPGQPMPYLIGKIRDRYITDSQIAISSEMGELRRPGNVYAMYLGGIFVPTGIEWLVEKSAQDAGPVSGNFLAIDRTGARKMLFATMDMKQFGQRFLDTSGASIQAGELSNASLPNSGIVSLQWTDGSASLEAGRRAKWRMVVRGHFIEQT